MDFGTSPQMDRRQSWPSRGLRKNRTAFHADRRENEDAVHQFLAFRCGEPFLRRYLERERNFLTQLHVGSYFDAVSDIDVLNTLHSVGYTIKRILG